MTPGSWINDLPVDCQEPPFFRFKFLFVLEPVFVVIGVQHRKVSILDPSFERVQCSSKLKFPVTLQSPDIAVNQVVVHFPSCIIPGRQFPRNSKSNVHQNMNFQYFARPQDIGVFPCLFILCHRRTMSINVQYS